ncbi:hypothetical protein RND81_10G099200 [Saponaria officinalis]|uniref:Uncharacterized protein n=1 Tax=Saponaria officinalis TaxID=3572 RepID=A0AAW1I2I7_SAPOF
MPIYICRHFIYYKVAPQTFHILEGSAEEKSWAMFKSIAFSSEVSKEDRTKILDFKIDPKILNMCANNPCAIKIHSFHSSTKTTLDEWTHFVEVVWPSIPVPPLETIASIFNFVAFKRLPFLIKRCLLFRSLFPKDYEFNRVDPNLWLVREFKFKNIQTAVDFELSVCLTALETMSICWIYNFKELPEWIGSPNHLCRIVVRTCPSLSTIPESLGHLMDVSSDLRVEFGCCGTGIIFSESAVTANYKGMSQPRKKYVLRSWLYLKFFSYCNLQVCCLCKIVLVL